MNCKHTHAIRRAPRHRLEGSTVQRSTVKIRGHRLRAGVALSGGERANLTAPTIAGIRGAFNAALSSNCGRSRRGPRVMCIIRAPPRFSGWARSPGKSSPHPDIHAWRGLLKVSTTWNGIAIRYCGNCNAFSKRYQLQQTRASILDFEKHGSDDVCFTSQRRV